MFLVCGTVAFGLIPKHGFLPYLLTVFLFSFFAAVIWLLFALTLNVLTASEKKGVLGKHIFEIDADGFKEESPSSSTTTKWIGVDDIWVFRDVSYVMISGYRFHIIPSRAFDSVESYEEFAKQLQAYAHAT